MMVLSFTLLLIGLADRIVSAARAQVGVTVTYDPAYRRIAYPGGDVPQSTGVCTDVVIRAMRSVGVDLQRLVHQDMKRAFSQYPPKWGLRRPDSNIDHRRVPNLQTFFRRTGRAVSGPPRPGDFVTWVLPGGRDHIGVVTRWPLIVHNIGAGAREESIGTEWRRTGHYRWRFKPRE